MEEKRSELSDLLSRNASVGLTNEELRRAEELIANPEYSSNELCCVCREGKKDKAIYDTRLCVGHAFYVLYTRK